MKAFWVLCVLGVCVVGCQARIDKSPVLARINNYEITQEEFDRQFKEFNFGREDTIEGRREFLQNLIRQKLILQSAQVDGVDTMPVFLKVIERFWEEALTRLAIDTKTRQFDGSITVSEKEIEEAYRKTRAGGSERPSQQELDKVKSELVRIKENQMLKNWYADLYGKAKIEVDEELLKRSQ